MSEIKGRISCSQRTRGDSLPAATNMRKEKKDRGPATCLFRGQDHSQRLLEEFDTLRNLQSGGGLVDLDIVCLDEVKIKVHKVVMAASSTFFREQLCRANVLVPVVLRLEDFGFNLSYEAVSLIIEFIYKGEVNIASNQLIGMAHAAHSLGIDGLKEFLPNTFADPTRSSESSRNGCNSSDCSPEKIINKTKTTKASKRNIPGGTVACRPVTVTRKVKTSKAEIGGNKDSNIIDQDEFDSCDDIIVLDCDDEEDINITNDMKASSDDLVVSTCNKTIIKHDNKSNEEHSKKVSQMTDNDVAQKISIKDKSSETLKLHERNEILINTTNERTSPQTSQPPHSTNTDNEEEDIDSVYASSACEGTGNISEIQNDDGRNEVQKLTVNKSMVKSYEGLISTRPEGEECSSVEEVQHCSVGSSVPLPKNTNHSPQLVSSTSPMLSSHNSFINESTNNLNTENLSHENSINTVETEMQQENHNFQNEAGEHEASKSIPNVPSGIISPVTTEVHSRMSEVHENTITASSQDSQHCYIPITSSNNPNLLPLQSNSQSYQLFHPAAMPFVPSSEVVMKHNRPHIENQINLVNVPTTKIGQTLSTSTCSTASSQSLRTVSNTGKSKGKLRVINQVGTIVGNTTPNIQASSTGSEVNFHHAFGDDGRSNNTTTCNYNQTQQFFDTILSAQADGSLHFRPNNQIDNMMLSTSANSSEMYSTEGNNILGQHPDYGHPNSSDINVGNEEVTIIEEIAIGNQAESIPFNIPNNSGYQYQQPMHPDLNGFQTVSFTNDVVYHHSTPPHNQAQHHHRIQDHPPPPPLWMPTCPPPPLAAAPQQAFSAVAAHAVAQAAVAQHQNNYEELQAMTSNATINESGENMGSRNAINNILVGTDSTGNTWNCSQNSISYQVLDDNGCIRKRNGGALQKESKSKKEEFEDVQEYIEVDEEERRRVLNTTLSGVVVRTEPPDLDEVSWSVPHSPNMAIENHNHADPMPSDRPTTNHPTTNWSWTTPAEDSIVDWSTRLASMTGNPQIHIENSSTGNTSQVSQNWHTLAVSTGTMPSNSLATPTSTISESPPLMLLSDSSAAATHSKPSHTSEANSMNPRSPIRIRHQSSDLVSLLATSKANSGPCSIVSEPSSNVEKEQKTSGLPLLADVAQVAAAAVSVKAEKSSIKNQKKRKKTNSREEFEELCGSNDNRKGSFSIKRPNKGELEVRKDLTIPSASLQRKSEDEINVFQADILPSSSGLTNFLEPMEQNVVNSLYNNLPSIEQPVRSSKTRQRKKYCLDCSMTFVTTNRLKQHVRHAHRREEIFSCPTCSEQNLRGKENLKLHMYKCHGIGEIFRCEDCNFETSARAHFTKHTLTVHPSDPDGETDDSTAISGAPFGNKGNPGITIGCEGNLRSHDTSIGIATETQAKANVVRSHRFTCKYCTRGFKSKAGLKLHLQQHTNESMHHCMVCPFRTPQQQNLVKHLATKHKKSLDGEDLKADKECQFCEFKCVAQYQLKAHNLRKHTDRSDMKYKCNDCGYASVEKSALVKHIRFRHTKERPFMCETCGFSTHTKSAMIRHNLSHTGEKPHVCDKCGSAYADKKRLRDHKLSQHNDGQGYECTIQAHDCDFCGFSSRRKDNLRAHVRRVHPELSDHHLSNNDLERNQQLPSRSSRASQSLPRCPASGMNVVINPLFDPPKTEETKPDIRLVNSSILTSPNKKEKSFQMDSSSKSNPNNKFIHNFPVNSSANRLLHDRSHIIGHINQDGSIRPVATATPSHFTIVLDDSLSINNELKGFQAQQPSNFIRTSESSSGTGRNEIPINLDLEPNRSSASEVVQSNIASENT